MRKILLITLLITYSVLAQKPFSDEPFAHTFSIVARDKVTGQIGVAVQSHWFSVGSIVSWAEAGVGAIATQSFVNPAFGPDGLKLLKAGKSAKEVLDILINGDANRDVRQLAIIDKNGEAASYTGKKCVEYAGNIVGDNFSVQANMMLTDKVWPAMEEAFIKNKNLPLAERLIATLEAAQSAGGDIRGKQSAALLIVKPEATGKIWEDRMVDLSIADSNDPIKELKRVLKVHRAYEHMNKGDLAIENNKMNLAMEEYSKAEEMFPQNLEMKYWHAVTLANNGNIEEALPLFKFVFERDMNWHTMTSRLIKPGLLTVKESDLKKILNQH